MPLCAGGADTRAFGLHMVLRPQLCQLIIGGRILADLPQDRVTEDVIPKDTYLPTLERCLLVPRRLTCLSEAVILVRMCLQDRIGATY